ncbi:MAG: amino acid ABC transporter permease [Ramlibacter sp.]
MTLDWSVVWDNRAQFAQGALMTVQLSALTMLIALPGGMVLALMRLSRFRLVERIATCYVEFFRCTPLILQVYWAFYVLPSEFNIQFSEFNTGLIALSLNVSAYNSESFRAGINSIRKGQVEAGRALGMNSWQVARKVVLPQAVRRVLPVLANTWVSLFKDTSLVSVIAVAELSYVSMQLRSQTFRVFETLSAMAAIYWLMGYPQAKLVDWINRKYRVTE